MLVCRTKLCTTTKVKADKIPNVKFDSDYWNMVKESRKKRKEWRNARDRNLVQAEADR